MKVIRACMAGALLVSFAGLLWAGTPELLPKVNIKDGAVNLQVAFDAIPLVVDWNNDGAKDLVVGEFTNGWITLFLNQGTDLNPVFDGGEKLESNGVPITVTYG